MYVDLSQSNFQALAFERRLLERDELELALKSDARLDAELDLEDLLTDLEELILSLLLLLLLLMLLCLLLEEDLLERELLELEEEDVELFFRSGDSNFLSFIKTGFPSVISSSLRLICLMSFSAAFGPI